MMELKSTKNGNFFVGNIGRFLYFDVSKGPGEKKYLPSRVMPKLCVFHPDMVQGCLGVSV